MRARLCYIDACASEYVHNMFCYSAVCRKDWVPPGYFFKSYFYVIFVFHENWDLSGKLCGFQGHRVLVLKDQRTSKMENFFDID